MTVATDGAQGAHTADHILKLSAKLTVDAFESCLYRRTIELTNAHSIVIDLSSAIVIEVESLAHIISHFLLRRDTGKLTELRLPARRSVRDLLRAWNFPDGLSAAVGKPFRDLVSADGLKYLSEEERAGAAPGRRSPATVFPFQTFLLQEFPTKQAVVAAASERWRSEYMDSLLRAYFGSRGRRLSTHVMNESIINAIQRPNVRVLQTAAMLDEQWADGVGRFTYVIWDDGDSIVSTIKQPLEEGRLLQAGEYPTQHRNYHVLSFDVTTGAEHRLTVNSADLPDRHSPPGILLLGSTYPGITTTRSADFLTAHRKSGRNLVRRPVAPDTAAPVRMDRQGIGLQVLINTVVDVFGGEVSMRCENYFVNVKRDRVDATEAHEDHPLSPLRVRLIQYPERTGVIKGNILTVRIPLNMRLRH